MAPEPLHDAIMAALAGEISRRELLARALALGLSGSAAATLLAACSGASATPSPSVPADRPEIVPAPLQATYGGLLPLVEPICASCPPGNLQDRLAETAERAGVRLAFDADCRAGSSRLSVTLGAADLPTQGYRLTIADAKDAADIAIEAADEAGAFYGVLSLEQLLVAGAGAARFARTASMVDQPSFERRGAIIDPPQLERLRVGVPYKMNLLAMASGMPPDVSPLVDFARTHYVELLSMVGYRDQLTHTPIADLKGILSSQYQLGIRSFCLKWDDLRVDEPAAMATIHAAIFSELYDHLRALDAATRISAVLPPYGGIPGVNLLSGEPGARYLALMKERLPADVLVFWTGDGGVFAESVTAAGARAYAELVGHPIGLWDNNALWFINGRRPLWGRAADLPTAISAYMGNMVTSESPWTGTAGEVALLTELQYAWHAETYEPMAACAAAERILRATGAWDPKTSTCASPVPMGTPHPLQTPAASPSR